MINRLFKFLILLPHIITFVLMSESVKTIFIEDMKLYYDFAYKAHWKINFERSIDVIQLFVRLMSRHKDLRNIFYFRLKSDKTTNFISVLNFLCPQVSTLFMSPPNKMKVEGGGILFFHPFSTIVNAKKIGKGCIIRHNTTIGNTHEILTNVPIIGDNVNIGAGCIIIGNIVIGSNVTIGAGSVVVKNVPDNCVIAGNPARIIKMKE